MPKRHPPAAVAGVAGHARQLLGTVLICPPSVQAWVPGRGCGVNACGRVWVRVGAAAACGGAARRAGGTCRDNSTAGQSAPLCFSHGQPVRRTWQRLDGLQQPAGAALPGVTCHAAPAHVVMGGTRRDRRRRGMAADLLARAGTKHASDTNPAHLRRVMSHSIWRYCLPAGHSTSKAHPPSPPHLPNVPQACHVKLNLAHRPLVVLVVLGALPHIVGIPASSAEEGQGGQA